MSHLERQSDNGSASGDQGLLRAMSPLGSAAIALAFLTPTTSVFVTSSVLLGQSGSAAFLSFVIAAFAALALALCFAELGAAFPSAGGQYSLVAKVLGSPAGFVVLVLLIIEVAMITAATALGAAQYLAVIVPDVSSHVIATAMMVAATAIAIRGIRFNARITVVFLALELAALSVVIGLGFSHAQQPLDLLVHPQVANEAGQLATVGFGTVIAGIAIALFAYEGYEMAIVFSEETKGPRRHIGRAVVAAVVIGVGMEILAVAAAILGAPSLVALQTADSPFLYTVEAASSPGLSDVVSLGVAIAIFNAVIAALLTLGRVVYSSARDQTWPQPLNRALGTLHPTQRTPWMATLAFGVLCGAVDAVSSVAAIVTFTSVVILFIYALTALAALGSRFMQPALKRPFRMPLWPLPPIVALAAVALALSKQSNEDMIIVAAIVAAAAIYWFAYLHPRRASRWSPVVLPDETPGEAFRGELTRDEASRGLTWRN